MIPKIIHYCWFGRGEKPTMIKKCMNSWKKYMSDYQLMEWNEDTFDIHMNAWVEQAYESRNFAFVADYVRFYALSKWGGVYLDTDILIKKNMDRFLNASFFSALEFPLDYNFLKQYHITDDNGNYLGDKSKPTHLCMCGILVAIMGSEKGHPILYDCLNYYHNTTFTAISSSMSNESIVCDDIMLSILWKYGYKLKDETQQLEHGIVIYDAHVFGGSLAHKNKNNYAIHMCSSTWRNEPNQKRKNFIKTCMCYFFS